MNTILYMKSSQVGCHLAPLLRSNGRQPLVKSILRATFTSSSSSASKTDTASELIKKNTQAYFNQYKLIHEAPQRLVCFGDIHGDLQAFEEMLLVAGLIKKEGGEWTGGSTVLVQVGEYIYMYIFKLRPLIYMYQFLYFVLQMRYNT